jgi:hypothetical protein
MNSRASSERSVWRGAAPCGSAVARYAAGGGQQPFQLSAPRAHALGHARAGGEVTQDGLSRRDVALLVVDAARQNAAGRRLVDRIGVGEMISVRREQMGLQHAVDADQPLDGLIGTLGVLERVHERGDRGVRGLGDLGSRAELGQPLSERVAMLGEIPHVAPHQELRGELGRQRDPAAERPHGALDHVPVVAEQTSGVVGAERPFEGLGHAGQ